MIVGALFALISCTARAPHASLGSAGLLLDGGPEPRRDCSAGTLDALSLRYKNVPGELAGPADDALPNPSTLWPAALADVESSLRESGPAVVLPEASGGPVLAYKTPTEPSLALVLRGAGGGAGRADRAGCAGGADGFTCASHQKADETDEADEADAPPDFTSEYHEYYNRLQCDVPRQPDRREDRKKRLRDRRHRQVEPPGGGGIKLDMAPDPGVELFGDNTALVRLVTFIVKTIRATPSALVRLVTFFVKTICVGLIIKTIIKMIGDLRNDLLSFYSVYQNWIAPEPDKTLAPKTKNTMVSFFVKVELSGSASASRSVQHSADTTIAEVVHQQLVRLKMTLDATKFTVQMEGKVLPDLSATLKDAGITQGSTIRIIPRIRGGMRGGAQSDQRARDSQLCNDVLKVNDGYMETTASRQLDSIRNVSEIVDNMFEQNKEKTIQAFSVDIFGIIFKPAREPEKDQRENVLIHEGSSYIDDLTQFWSLGASSEQVNKPGIHQYGTGFKGFVAAHSPDVANDNGNTYRKMCSSLIISYNAQLKKGFVARIGMEVDKIRARYDVYKPFRMLSIWFTMNTKNEPEYDDDGEDIQRQFFKELPISEGDNIDSTKENLLEYVKHVVANAENSSTMTWTMFIYFNLRVVSNPPEEIECNNLPARTFATNGQHILVYGRDKRSNEFGYLQLAKGLATVYDDAIGHVVFDDGWDADRVYTPLYIAEPTRKTLKKEIEKSPYAFYDRNKEAAIHRNEYTERDIIIEGQHVGCIRVFTPPEVASGDILIKNLLRKRYPRTFTQDLESAGTLTFTDESKPGCRVRTNAGKILFEGPEGLVNQVLQEYEHVRDALQNFQIKWTENKPGGRARSLTKATALLFTLLSDQKEAQQKAKEVLNGLLMSNAQSEASSSTDAPPFLDGFLLAGEWQCIFNHGDLYGSNNLISDALAEFVEKHCPELKSASKFNDCVWGALGLCVQSEVRLDETKWQLNEAKDMVLSQTSNNPINAPQLLTFDTLAKEYVTAIGLHALRFPSKVFRMRKLFAKDKGASPETVPTSLSNNSRRRNRDESNNGLEEDPRAVRQRVVDWHGPRRWRAELELTLRGIALFLCENDANIGAKFHNMYTEDPYNYPVTGLSIRPRTLANVANSAFKEQQKSICSFLTIHILKYGRFSPPHWTGGGGNIESKYEFLDITFPGREVTSLPFDLDDMINKCKTELAVRPILNLT